MGLPTRGKVTGDSFLVNLNSKMRIAGQLRRGWSCPNHTFLFHTCIEKAPCRLKGDLSQGIFYPDAFLAKSILAKRCVYSHSRILRYTQIWTVNQANQDWPRKPRRKAIKKFKPSQGCDSVTHSLPKSASVSVHMHCILFLLINTLLVLPLSIFVGILFCKNPKAPGPLSLTLI